MRLRRLERADLDYVLEWTEDPRFRAFVFGDSRRTWRQHGAQALALLGGSAAAQNAGIGFFLVTDDTEGHLGLAGIYEMQWRNRHCSTNLYLTAPHRRVETFSEGWMKLFGYCLDELNLHRVSTRVAASETESVAALDALQVSREVVYRGHLLSDGSPQDMYGYGLLRSEYEAMLHRTTAAATGSEA